MKLNLKSLALENYRSFKGKHEIKFSPITLLFGANSAGKSAIINAIKSIGVQSDNSSLKDFNKFSVKDVYKGENKASIRLNFDIENLSDDFALSSHHKMKDISFNQKANFIKSIKNISIVKSIANPYPEYKIEDKSNFKYSINFLVYITEIFINNELLIRFVDSENFDLEKNDINKVILNFKHSLLNENLSVNFSTMLNEKINKNLGEDFQNEITDILRASIEDSRANSNSDIKYLLKACKIKKLDEVYNKIEKSYLRILLAFLNVAFNKANSFALGIENLGPLRKIPATNFKLSAPEPLNNWSTKRFFEKEIGFAINSDKDSYVGKRAWEYLCEDRQLLAQTNNWLANWFNVSYELSFESVYTLVVNTLEKQQALEQGKITEEHFTNLDLLVRIKNLFNGSVTSAEDIGVGISQLAPVIVSALTLKAFSVEQPELHIHPRMQTVVGDLFVFAGLFEQANVNDKDAIAVRVKNLEGKEVIYYFKEKLQEEKSFILAETHSEHLLLRLLKRIREGILKPEDVAINYVENNRGKSQVVTIGIDEEGDFNMPWPNGFFEERLEELF